MHDTCEHKELLLFVISFHTCASPTIAHQIHTRLLLGCIESESESEAEVLDARCVFWSLYLAARFHLPVVNIISSFKRLLNCFLFDLVWCWPRAVPSAVSEDSHTGRRRCWCCLVFARDNIFVINLFDIYFLTSNSFIIIIIIIRSFVVELKMLEMVSC